MLRNTLAVTLVLWPTLAVAQPTFTFSAPDHEFLYSSGDFSVSFESIISFEVTSGAPAVPGFSYSIAHDPEVVEVQSVFMTETMATLNFGNPPDFWNLGVWADAITLGCIITFSPWPPEFETGDVVDVIEVTYQVPPALLATGIDTTTEIAFVDGLGEFPVDNTVVVGGVSYSPDFDPGVVVIAPAPEDGYDRGDCNDDGGHDLADAVTILDHLFAGAPAPSCFAACDVNDDAVHDIADAIYLIGYLHYGGEPLPAPFGFCGDPTGPCLIYVSCP